MPTLEQNLQKWGQEHDWENSGDEWSEKWGNSDLMWEHSVKPRISRHLQSKVMLEIAPGFGRWSNYLKDFAKELHLVDYSKKCIDACRERFANEKHIHYHVNDGRSLGEIRSDSVDFVFSFDSLVHVELEELSSYLTEISRVLKPDGTAFIHHSNLGSYKNTVPFYIARAIRKINLPILRSRDTLLNSWRAESVEYETVYDVCRKVGLNCPIQELINWYSGRHLKDCITTITKEPNSQRIIVRNRDFMMHAAIIKNLQIYT